MAWLSTVLGRLMARPVLVPVSSLRLVVWLVVLLRTPCPPVCMVLCTVVRLVQFRVWVNLLPSLGAAPLVMERSPTLNRVAPLESLLIWNRLGQAKLKWKALLVARLQTVLLVVGTSPLLFRIITIPLTWSLGTLLLLTKLIKLSRIWSLCPVGVAEPRQMECTWARRITLRLTAPLESGCIRWAIVSFPHRFNPILGRPPVPPDTLPHLFPTNYE